MKPKLIIINGPLASGKSTLAQIYADENPLTLNLDVDEIRKLISSWRELKDESGLLSKKMALAMAKVQMEAGHNVVIPRLYRSAIYLEELEELATNCNSEFYEFVLWLDKKESIKRFMNRGGLNPGGIIASNGGVDYLEKMFDELVETLKSRPGVIKIEPVFGDEEGTYNKMLGYL